LKKHYSILTAFIVLILVGYAYSSQHTIDKNVSTITKEAKQINLFDSNLSNISLQHKWTISFDAGLNKNMLNKNSVYILDKEKNKVPVSLEFKDHNTLAILPPSGGYSKNSTYVLYVERDLDLENVDNLNLPNTYKIKFSTSESL